ncbi:MAG: DNRLRE domain-containing protein [Syntrophomonadaceae bacterium]
MALRSSTPTQDAFVHEWYPDQNFGTIIALFTGQFTQPGDSYRSLLKFDLSSLPPASTINSSYLNLYMYRNETSADGCYIALYRLLNNWSQDTVTWNSQPPFSPSPFSPIWDAVIYISSSTPLGLISIDITDLVKGWFNGSIVNNGLIMVGEEVENCLVGFYSTNHPYSTMWPQLTVNFVQGIINVFDTDELTIPTPPSDPVIPSTPVPLGAGQSATFGVLNNSASTSVEAKIQVGFETGPGAPFFDAGEWVPLEPNGSPGEAVALSTSAAAEYTRVILKGGGGESIWVYPRTKEL